MDIKERLSQVLEKLSFIRAGLDVAYRKPFDDVMIELTKVQEEFTEAKASLERLKLYKDIESL
jgi:hypothetical protein